MAIGGIDGDSNVPLGFVSLIENLMMGGHGRVEDGHARGLGFQKRLCGRELA